MSIHDGVQFKGYATNNLPGAIAAYTQDIRIAPTLAVVRRDFKLIGENGIVVRSRHGAAGAILLTHYSAPQDWNEGTITMPMKAKPFILIETDEEQKKEDAKKVYLTTKKHKGKAGSCPHCTQRIEDFNKLGFWYGWALGIIPPYWDELRMFVFKRDKFTCTTCGAKHPATELQAHHVRPKEEGGSDSARNIVSLCGMCHKDPHPIMLGE